MSVTVSVQLHMHHVNNTSGTFSHHSQDIRYMSAPRQIHVCAISVKTDPRLHYTSSSYITPAICWHLVSTTLTLRQLQVSVYCSTPLLHCYIFAQLTSFLPCTLQLPGQRHSRATSFLFWVFCSCFCKALYAAFVFLNWVFSRGFSLVSLGMSFPPCPWFVLCFVGCSVLAPVELRWSAFG